MPTLSAGLPQLKDGEFRALRDLIGRAAGIHLTDAKRQLVASRLAGRLRHHALAGYGEYLELLSRSDPEGSELREMINCITTNKTSFYREAHHFDLLREEVLARHAAGVGPVRIWSAGCSSGEEPYTIALTALEEHGARAGERVRIEASDIDTRVLAAARAGVYDEARLGDVPAALRRKHFLRGTGEMAGRVRVSPESRALVSFRRLNLITEAWPWEEPFDVIFCRNVIIYFDAPTRQRLMERFARRLKPGGLLILGHSESLHPEQRLYEPLGRTAFRLRGAAPPPAAAPAAPPSAAARARAPHRTIVAGEVFAGSEPTLVRTVLGSCVAACLYDPVAGVGGMNHFMLPVQALGDRCASARYGVHAMELLINEILQRGGDRRRLQAKAFGAASLIRTGLPSTVSTGNARFVREFLALEGIPLVAEHLGGAAALDVRMRARTGEVWIREIGSDQAEQALAAERRHAARVESLLHRPLADDVTLF